MNTKIAWITGATSGIGEATTLKLADNGFDVITTGRRNDRLTALKEKLEKNGTRVLSLCFDVRVEAEVKSAVENLPDEWKNIDVLVNNAGLAAGLSAIQDGDTDDWNRMIDTNIKGLLYITRYVSPLMIKRETGHIINIGSIAGKEVYPNGNVYCATKHAVDALTKGMRMDMLKPDRCEINGENFHWQGDALVIGIGNGRQAGGGQQLCPDALINDGLLQLRIFTSDGLLPALFTTLTNPEESPNILDGQSAWFEIIAPHGMTFNLDGEPLSGEHFRISLLPRALNCRLPPDCPLLR